MRIACPHCGPRGLEEFAYHGDATVRRPTDGGGAPTKEWTDYVYFRDNANGPHQELWYPAPAATLGSWSRATSPRTKFPPRKISKRRRMTAHRPSPPAASLTVASRLPSPLTANPTKVLPATPWPRRCSPTMCRLVARSLQISPPARHSLPAGSEEPNALVELAHRRAVASPTPAPPSPNFSKASTATSQNRFPSLRYDFSQHRPPPCPSFAAGFYYKTFMWPASFWEKLYEPMIRRAAGLGRSAARRTRTLTKNPPNSATS